MKAPVRPTLTLNGVAKHFEQWRSTKKKGERIPERLWSEAIGLLGEHSLSQVTRTLRLGWADLNQRRRMMDSGKDRQSIGGAMAFVEIDTSVVDQTLMPSDSTVAIELERSDGLRLRLHRAKRADMLALIERFMGM